MASLPQTERILLGPGPSLASPRVMRALAAPVVSHLDPQMVALLDDVRERLVRLFRAPEGSFALAVSGTGTSGMETAVANLVQPGTRAHVVVTGYFGERLAQMLDRYGATVTRTDVEWGRACDPAAVRAALKTQPADVVAMVHAETSTGVLNPVEALAAVAREQGAVTIVDAVTSFGGHPLEVGPWGLGAVYSCSQKCLSAPSGLAPVVFTPEARARAVKSRSFYFDLALLEDYWVRRKYHHTMSSTLVYALHEALAAVDEEGLQARWARHERHHRILLAGLEAMGLSVLPPAGERLWTLNAVTVPAGVDEAAVRKLLLTEFQMEIGSGLGPLAGRIWRVGLMGASSAPHLILLFLGALERALRAQGVKVPPGAGTAAAVAAMAN
ncbi:MAG: alanine--glyoxylate aminotransferase family protein [Acidobacteriota bacterium]|nr:alanine--glyoxylate aminotransferase family protein [Acidobacteriota bacterium]